MELIEVNEISPALTEQLLEVWDKSVRETHLFLTDSEIKNIADYIPLCSSSRKCIKRAPRST